MDVPGVRRRMPGMLVAMLLLAICAPAEEITVKNDSAVDASTVAIQAGFVAGERAAAWLTSPCDGRIVAVQVGEVPGGPEGGIGLLEAQVARG